MYNDDRAVSVAVGYVLNFAVAALLVSGLLIAGGGLIDSQTKEVTTDELSVIGHQLADELSSADRLVRAGDVSTLSIRTELPRGTTAGEYTIEIDIEESSDEGTIVLRTSSPEVTVTVPFQIRSALEEDQIGGGPVRIEYDGSQLAVVSA